MTAALVMSGIDLSFNGFTVLDGLDLEVEAGEIHALIGPNGAGKSSCFNVATGLYRANRGTVVIGGKDATHLPPHARHRLGLSRTFQNLMLVGELTVRENLLLSGPHATRAGLFASAVGLPSARRRAHIDVERMERVAARIGVSHLLETIVGELPYGKRKHVEIARALCAEPTILMLDEPAAGLSEAETGELAGLLDSLMADGDLTIVIVEHHVGLVMSLADRITVLSAGSIVATGDPAFIRNHPAVLEAYLGTLSSDPTANGMPVTAPVGSASLT